MTQRIWHVDAFTDRPFSGNPAAVCPLDGPKDDAWLLAVAAELNLSETAFLWEQGGCWDLRWFAPKTEVELCGHATLASAHVLWSTGRLAPDQAARFQTRSGELTARRMADGWIELDFPEEVATEVPAPAGLAEALGLAPFWLGQNRMDYLVLAESEAEVAALAPDMAALKAIPSRGFIVTAPAGAAGDDFVSRFFCPAVGVEEDPVTGSAHCALGPFWAARLGKDRLTASQVSARGGKLKVRLVDRRVRIAGQAVTVLTSELSA